jgi:hypothetical protein
MVPSYPSSAPTLLPPTPTDATPEPGKAPRKLTFRRLLLNKCQEEFEKGDAAMRAVEAREAKDRERAEAGEADNEVGVVGWHLCGGGGRGERAEAGEADNEVGWWCFVRWGGGRGWQGG